MMYKLLSAGSINALRGFNMVITEYTDARGTYDAKLSADAVLTTKLHISPSIILCAFMLSRSYVSSDQNGRRDLTANTSQFAFILNVELVCKINGSLLHFSYNIVSTYYHYPNHHRLPPDHGSEDMDGAHGKV